jgi:hypothetical protein
MIVTKKALWFTAPEPEAASRKHTDATLAHSVKISSPKEIDADLPNVFGVLGFHCRDPPQSALAQSWCQVWARAFLCVLCAHAHKRKNWIHVGRQQAGPKIAAILSVVESCRRMKLPVRDYMAAILPGLADLPLRSVTQLTPSARANTNR